MSKVLVTGANGFIGKHVVHALLDSGESVIASDIYTEDMDPRVTLCKAALFSGDEDIYTQVGSPDVCIHLAWRNGFMHNAPTHMDELSDHLMFCKNMMAGGLPILSVMGTMHEVGYWEGAIDENTPCNPQTQYGIAKNAMRQSLQISVKDTGCTLHWLRLYYIVSDDVEGSNIFARILQTARAGKHEFPFTSGKNLYDFIDIDEMSRLIVLASLQKEISGITNVCTGKPVSLADCTERFIREHALSIKLVYGQYPDRAYDSPGVWGNASKIERIIANSKLAAHK